MLEEKYIPSQKELEDLFINNEKLLQLNTHLSRFNPIKVMKMENMEIRHSAILGWLLDPRESHGLEDKFLKSFLSQALRSNENTEVTALEISKSDLREAEVRVEWLNIDLLILSEANNWAFVIENKFHSKQHDGQLKKYKETVIKTFPSFKVDGIFLILNEEEPQDKSFVTLYYWDVLEVLLLTKNQYETKLSDEINIFIDHYIEILKEATWMKDDMEKVAKELYRDHKKVIDYVIEHGASTDFALAATTLFGDEIDRYEEKKIDNYSFTYNAKNNVVVSFLPTFWANSFDILQDEWFGCENWWAGYPIICWLEIRQNTKGSGGKVWLYGEVGPLKEHSKRSSLISLIEDNPTDKILFQKSAKDEGKKYSKFFKNNSLLVKDVHDVEEIEASLRTLLKKFHKEFDAISVALDNFLK